jgi:Sec-independent protein translocase protein TatA
MSTVEQDVTNLKTDTAELRNLLRILGEEIREFRANVDAAQANWEQRWAKLEQEREKERREMNKKWGELANKMGTLVEDIIAPNIQRLACELFDVGDLVDFSEFRSITHPTDKSRFKDFDALFIGSRGIILNETASTVRQSYIDEFIAFIPTVFEYLPEHKGKRVIPVFSSLYIPEQFVRYLTANKIYAMAMGDETMEILNYNDIPKP